MIEAWGRGIEHMIDACKAADVPVPLLRYETSWAMGGVSHAGSAETSQDQGRYYPRSYTKDYSQKISPEDSGDPCGEPLCQSQGNRRALADITEDGVKYHLDRLKAAAGFVVSARRAVVVGKCRTMLTSNIGQSECATQKRRHHWSSCSSQSCQPPGKENAASIFHSPLKKMPLSEKSFAFTLWVVKLAKYLQGEKEFVLSKYALGF